ncbi:DUF2075 domain-containing protein [Vitreoscilla stercoraria]|uniref:DUF2075 domain-containing protein n=1 Tax=Vitreoscilla stercoraria TaxID=61 RepID=A0ABY4ECB2_VITST|nr:DUF2075 domain-containing protein [Vitreoscilla stercoraria]UOO93385.1 DUF2075 domain-containing protein [Vitreoscilla stercoraria]
MMDPEIPNDSNISIEYNIPLTNRRVDFIVTGKNPEKIDTAIIIELKQWSDLERTNKDAIVKTFLGKQLREVVHPSYQAWTYSALINDYNETVRNENIQLIPCTYLHNLKNSAEVKHDVYQEHIDKAPVFISSDVEKLSRFISKHIKFGDSTNVMYRIENGKIKPSKNLSDYLSSMLQGNEEFILLDNQKLVYEQAIQLAEKTKLNQKHCLIVKGGPGTGKSVLAINLLVKFTHQGLLTQYVSKNSAPRDVFKAKLTKSLAKGRIDSLFKGSGSYIDQETNFFDALLVDEAHRLNAKSGMFSHLGENQIKEIIAASKLSIFFIDEAQKVTFKDIGSIDEIKKHALALDAKVTELELESQFRCNGSDGYLAWLDSVLNIRPTANLDLDGIDYDFRVFDNPVELHNCIRKLNDINNKSRMVAGYCWPWSSKNNPDLDDIVIENCGYSAKWNLGSDGMLWAIAPKSVEEVGCIHTCQGLEFDYVGVIIGDDFVIRDGKVVTNPDKRAKSDKSISGYKKLLKSDAEHAKNLVGSIIKNTYRTLMTRGQKGCFIYCTDQETQNYFKKLLNAHPSNSVQPEKNFDLQKFKPNLIKSTLETAPNKVYLPVYNYANPSVTEQWFECPYYIQPISTLFVATIDGAEVIDQIQPDTHYVFNKDMDEFNSDDICLMSTLDAQEYYIGTLKNAYEKYSLKESDLKVLGKLVALLL